MKTLTLQIQAANIKHFALAHLKPQVKIHTKHVQTSKFKLEFFKWAMNNLSPTTIKIDSEVNAKLETTTPKNSKDNKAKMKYCENMHPSATLLMQKK